MTNFSALLCSILMVLFDAFGFSLILVSFTKSGEEERYLCLIAGCLCMLVGGLFFGPYLSEARRKSYLDKLIKEKVDG